MKTTTEHTVVERQCELVAHIRKKDNKIQPLIEHLRAVSKLAGEFAGTIGMKETGEILGLLHDFGKANEKFRYRALTFS